MNPYSYKKQPSDKRKLEFDPSKALATGDSVVSATAVIYTDIESTDVSSSMISGTPVISGGKIYVTVQGGTSGITYWLKLTATTANGDIIEDDLKLFVAQIGK